MKPLIRNCGRIAIERQVDRARQRDPRQNRVDVPAVRLPGRMPGMKPPYFAHVLRDVIGIEDDRRCRSSAKKMMPATIQQVVERHAVG